MPVRRREEPVTHRVQGEAQVEAGHAGIDREPPLLDGADPMTVAAAEKPRNRFFRPPRLHCYAHEPPGTERNSANPAPVPLMIRASAAASLKRHTFPERSRLPLPRTPLRSPARPQALEPVPRSRV